MCGRSTRHYTWDQLVRLYRLTSTPANIQPSYNVCPTDTVDTVVTDDGKCVLVTARWGLVLWRWKKPLKALKLATFNARVETVATKPMFRDAFKRHRCLIPASGYYEWEDTPDGKQPWYFTARDGSPVLTMAGLWDTWKNVETQEPLRSCTMIITEPNRYVAEVHDRMPVILKPEQFDAWLDGSMGVEDTDRGRLSASAARFQAGEQLARS
jgi:putative SOS response-associated peptidase YedK